MKITVKTRQGDHRPILNLKAENPAEQQELGRLHDDLYVAQLRGIKHGVCGRFNVCGSWSGYMGTKAKESLCISLLLGGAEIDIAATKAKNREGLETP